jgi:hypothetical protein
MALALAADSTMTTFMKALFRAPTGHGPIMERLTVPLFLAALPSGGVNMVDERPEVKLRSWSRWAEGLLGS